VCRRLLVEEGADIRKEFSRWHRDRSNHAEDLRDGVFAKAAWKLKKSPTKRLRKSSRPSVEPSQGLDDGDGHGQALARGIRHPRCALGASKPSMCLKNFTEHTSITDASLAEINPLILTGSGGSVRALDAKFNFDSNALFRHPEMVAFRDLDEEDPAEIRASEFDLAYIQLDGNIGCLVNGAGLADGHNGDDSNFLAVSLPTSPTSAAVQPPRK
jgi:succinyl-CoA synthetase beta subunit